MNGTRITYPTFDDAQRRVDQLRRQGLWPGVHGVDGGWQISYDPDEPLPGGSTDDGKGDAA